MAFLNITKKYHSDLPLQVRFLIDPSSVKAETTKGDYPKDQFRLEVCNVGEDYATSPNQEGETYTIRTNQDFQLIASESLYGKLAGFSKGDIAIITFMNKGYDYPFWRVEFSKSPKILEVKNTDNVQIDEEYEKQKMANSIQRKNRVSTTDDRIAWAVAVNNATKLVSNMSADLEEKVKAIEENTSRIFELVQSLDTYLENRTGENNNEENKQGNNEKEPWE